MGSLLCSTWYFFYEARITWSKSPLSFHDLLHRVTRLKIKVDSPLYSEIENFLCLPIDAKELKETIFADFLKPKKKKRKRKSHQNLKFFGNTFEL